MTLFPVLWFPGPGKGAKDRSIARRGRVSGSLSAESAVVAPQTAFVPHTAERCRNRRFRLCYPARRYLRYWLFSEITASIA
jgi:hypothetical protein